MSSDWKPLLEKTLQFKTFVAPPADIKYYVEPVLPPWDEIETRMADRLTDAYVDPSLKGNPRNIAATIHSIAPQTDQILKDANLYGTS